MPHPIPAPGSHARSRWGRTNHLESRIIEMGGRRHSYALARPGRAGAPLLIVLHGLGMSGKAAAALTGLGERAPAAGLACVFPDGHGQAWGSPRGPGGGAGDVEFLQALVEHLIGGGVARPGPVHVAGISNGALFVERLARRRELDVAGIVLVAGTTTKANRDARPLPAGPCEVACFAGTADPVMPYGGGPMGGHGPLGWMTSAKAKRRGFAGDQRLLVSTEALIEDWVAANGLAPEPAVQALATAAGEPGVTRARWSAEGRPPVTLYRIEGGGHTWPGGPQFMPSGLIGPVARSLDASGIAIEMAGGVLEKSPPIP